MAKQGFSFSKLFQRGAGEDEGAESEERRAKQRNAPPPGTQVLIVEDSRTMQAVMQKMLREAGYTTIEALDGESGVALAKEHRPALIIMDVVMPGITGFQATRQLRREPATAATPIIMISGNQQATDQFWATKIGANDYLVKPFNREQLFDSMDRLLYAESTPAADVEPAEAVVTPDQSYRAVDLSSE